MAEIDNGLKYCARPSDNVTETITEQGPAFSAHEGSSRLMPDKDLGVFYLCQVALD